MTRHLTAACIECRQYGASLVRHEDPNILAISSELLERYDDMLPHLHIPRKADFDDDVKMSTKLQYCSCSQQATPRAFVRLS